MHPGHRNNFKTHSDMHPGYRNSLKRIETCTPAIGIILKHVAICTPASGIVHKHFGMQKVNNLSPCQSATCHMSPARRSKNKFKNKY